MEGGKLEKGRRCCPASLITSMCFQGSMRAASMGLGGELRVAPAPGKRRLPERLIGRQLLSTETLHPRVSCRLPRGCNELGLFDPSSRKATR